MSKDRLLRVRLGAHQNFKRTFLTSLEGKLLVKNPQTNGEPTRLIQEQFRKGLGVWKYAPRAAIAVGFEFFGSDRSPSLHRLLKFYIDTLTGVLFNDDRQVRSITATFFGLPPIPRGLFKFESAPKSREAATERVFVKVERLADYKKRFDLYHEVLSDRDFALRPPVHPIDNVSWDSIHTMRASLKSEAGSVWPAEGRAFLEWQNDRDVQEKFLAANRISMFDRPDGPAGKPRSREFVSELSQKVSSMQLASAEIATLPSLGGSEHYKKEIQRSLSSLAQDIQVPTPFILPVEAEIALSPGLAGNLQKDLDNVLIDIASVLTTELIDEKRGGGLAGFRAFVDPTIREPNRYRLRLLAPGTIHTFESAVDEALEQAHRMLIGRGC